jgi:hypothetical protein
MLVISQSYQMGEVVRRAFVDSKQLDSELETNEKGAAEMGRPRCFLNTLLAA